MKCKNPFCDNKINSYMKSAKYCKPCRHIKRVGYNAGFNTGSKNYKKLKMIINANYGKVK